MTMANENDNIDPKEQPEKKPTWIEEALENIDSDFPLSGGETDDDLEFGDDDETDDDLNTQFPLSGGESDDRL